VPPLPPLWADPTVSGWTIIGNLRVGICWGSTAPERSTAAERLLDMTTAPGVSTVSLQVGPHAAAGRRLRLPSIPEGSDFATSAAYVKTCDLVVTVDTGLAHLSASLGVPTWVLLPDGFTAGSTFEHVPPGCYPSVRIFRQAAEVTAELEALDRERAA
jgi:ADP-heptose:LPS heptosyltransferase